MKDLTKRLEDAEKTILNLEASMTASGAKPPGVQTATQLPPSVTSRDDDQPESLQAASSADSTVSKSKAKPEETAVEAPSVPQLEAKSVEIFPVGTEVSKPDRLATDPSETGQDIRESSETLNSSKCEAQTADSIANLTKVSKVSEDPTTERDRSASAGPPDISKRKEKLVEKAEHPPSLPQQAAVPEQRAPESPKRLKSEVECSEGKTAEHCSLSLASSTKMSSPNQMHQPCKDDSAAAGISVSRRVCDFAKVLNVFVQIFLLLPHCNAFIFCSPLESIS